MEGFISLQLLLSLKGCLLKSIDFRDDNNVNQHIDFTYNANGIRTSKTVNGTKHEYLLDGTKILRESWGENILVPLYDNEDSVCGIEYNGTAYFFVKNLQGDIIAITNNSGNVVARYTYDAWGACTITQDNPHTIARLNPFRYRGYYYDTEIGMYYLQSRYYDPVVGRFINADDAEFVNFKRINSVINIYAYCANNPINSIDPTGYIELVSLTLVGVIGLCTLIGVAIINLLTNPYFISSLNDTILTFKQAIINGAEYLENVISDIVESVKIARKKYKGNEDHHIVAKDDRRADKTRKFIKKYGLNPSVKYNIVPLKKTFHKHLHTNAYFAAVDIFLRGCASRYRTYARKKYAIISGMLIIGVLLKTASTSL